MNILKTPAILLFTLGAVSVPSVVRASSVDESHIPAGTEWFVHIDADLIRTSRIGDVLIREFREINPITENPEIPIDPVLILNGLHGVTAFGSLPDISGNVEAVDAVAVIKGTPELMQVFRGLVSGMQLENPDALIEVESGGQFILKMAEEDVSGTFLGEDRLVIGKSLGSVVDFLAVHRGDNPHMAIQDRFPSYRLGLESGLFLGAFVDGLEGVQNLPAQARILQLTESVSVQLGEIADNVQLMASLGTDSGQTAKQVGDVLQGIIALTMITQKGEPDLAALIQSARVSLEDTVVSLELAYPVAAAEVWIRRAAEMAKAKMEEKAREAAAGEDTEAESDQESLDDASPTEPAE